MAAGASGERNVAVQVCPEGTWEVARVLPHPGLRGFVHHYQGLRYALDRPRTRLELPHDAVTLFLGFASPLEMWRPRHDTATPVRRASVLAGLQTEPVVGRHSGLVWGIEISFAPWGAFALLGVDMSDVAHTNVDARELPGHRWGRLVDALVEAPDWPSRFALLDRVLLKRAQDPAPWAPRVVHAWRLLGASGGTMSVPRLAAEVGWSPRTLGRVFHEQLGLKPKALSKVIRLQRALRLLLDGTSQAQTAAQCGFYDQAHLALDFRQMTAHTPGEFLTARAIRSAVPAGDRCAGRVTSLLLP